MNLKHSGKIQKSVLPVLGHRETVALPALIPSAAIKWWFFCMDARKKNIYTVRIFVTYIYKIVVYEKNVGHTHLSRLCWRSSICQSQQQEQAEGSGTENRGQENREKGDQEKERM